MIRRRVRRSIGGSRLSSRVVTEMTSRSHADVPAGTVTGDILIVDDDPVVVTLLARILQGLGRVRFATRGGDALRLMRERAPDVVLLDAGMPDMSGFEVCEAMKADDALRDVPVIFVTSQEDAAFELAGFQKGAADFIVKPVREALLIARVSTQLRVKQLTDQLRHLSATDPLTGLANRRRLDEMLATEWSRCQRGVELTLLLVDVDHFKLYNDRYGHRAGDACLRAVSEVLTQACARGSDLVARFGGEEFAVILPQTARDGAPAVVRRIFDTLEARGIPHDGSPTRSTVSVSIGVASFDALSPGWIAPRQMEAESDPRAHTADDLLQAADNALYAAKRHGRARAYILDVADAQHVDRARELALVARDDAIAAAPRAAP